MEHRGRDLDTPDEIFEMVTRQYVDVVQDDFLQPCFNFGPGFIDWQAHIESVTDYWCHVVLYAATATVSVPSRKVRRRPRWSRPRESGCRPESAAGVLRRATTGV